MGLFNDLKGVFSRNNAPVEVKNDSADDIRGAFYGRVSTAINLGGGRDMGVEISKSDVADLYTGLAETAIQLTAQKTAEFMDEYAKTVERKDPKTALDNTQHPYLKAIDDASEPTRFIYQAIAESILAFGDAYIYTGERVMENDTVREIQDFKVLEPAAVTPLLDRKTKELKGYRYVEPGTNNKFDYLASNVIYIHDINIFNLKRGRGRLRSIVRELLIERQSSLLQHATLINGQSTPAIISVDPDIPNDIWQNIQEAVRQRWSGVRNDKSGSPVVVKAKQLAYEDIMADYDKMAMTELKEGNDKKVRSRLGVSKTIQGIEESGVTRDTSETMTENFEDNHCKPLARIIFDALNQDYINTYPKEYTAKRQWEIALLIPDRRRVEDELKEAETIRSKASTVSIMIRAGFTPEDALMVAGIKNAEDIKHTGVIPGALADSTVGEEEKNSFLAGSDQHQVASNYCDAQGCHTNAFTVEDMTVEQRQLAKDIAEIDSKLLPIYLASLDKDIPAAKRRTYQRELETLLAGYYTATAKEVAPARYAEIAKKYGKGTKFTFDRKTFNELLDEASKAALSHLDTVDTNVKQIVAQVAKEELGEEVAKARVREYFEDRLTKYEAQRLAVDQSRRIYSEAKLLSDRQWLDEVGIPRSKAYKVFRNYGPNPCPFCSASAGKRVPIDSNFYDIDDVITASDDSGRIEAFKVGYADVTSGKLHPFCSCDYELVLED